MRARDMLRDLLARMSSTSSTASASPATLTSLGVRLDIAPAAFGALRDSTPDFDHGRMDELRRRYADEGYLLLRGLLAAADVEAAAADVVDSLAARGLIDARFPRSQRIAARRARVS